MATMLNPNAIPNGSITKEKIDASVLASKANLQHQHTVADITNFPELYYDATAFFTTGAYPSDKYEELLEAVKAKKTVYATIDEEGYISYIFFVSSAHSHGSSSHVLLTTTFEDGGNLYINTFVLQQSGMTPLQESITGKADKATTLAGYGIGDAYTKSEVDTALEGKQDTLTLTIKDNGNIVLSNIQGQSKEFMPATPSGDPMHYAYVAAGAEWNGTGADIIKTTPWADLVDDDADKTVVHKAGYWYLNGLGDINNIEMRYIFDKGILRASFLSGIFAMNAGRTAIASKGTPYFTADAKSLAYHAINLITIIISSSANVKDLSYAFAYCTSLIYIGIMRCDNAVPTSTTFYQCSSLKFIHLLKINSSYDFQYSPNLTSKSILYMIENEVSTSAITITLHADAYARAMANADILAALEAHPNVSLASA